MKKFLFLFCFIALQGFAYSPPPPTSKPQKVEAPAEKPKQEHPRIIIVKDKSKEKKEVGAPPYLFPGVVEFREGAFIGADNFFNFAKEIALEVSIHSDIKEEPLLNQEDLKKIVETAISKVRLTVSNSALDGKPPLPLLHVRILIVPLKIPSILGKKPKEGFIASCSFRLFEEVTLSRVILEKGTTFQAITWEAETIIVSPKEEFIKEVEQTVEKMADTFSQKFSGAQRTGAS